MVRLRGVIFGFVLAGYGFRKWLLIQRMQDQLLERELNKSS